MQLSTKQFKQNYNLTSAKNKPFRNFSEWLVYHLLADQPFRATQKPLPFICTSMVAHSFLKASISFFIRSRRCSWFTEGA